MARHIEGTSLKRLGNGALVNLQLAQPGESRSFKKTENGHRFTKMEVDLEQHMGNRNECEKRLAHGKVYIYDVRDSNYNGKQLLSLCIEYYLFLTNAFCQCHHQLYTRYMSAWPVSCIHDTCGMTSTQSR